MPFTLSHPAAVIPLHKLLGRRVSISAMIIGSMAPDFAYFLPGIHGLMTHSLNGILIFCLPAGLLTYFIFHLLIKRPASLLLPKPMLSRLHHRVFEASALPPTSIWVLAWSVMLGAATHIAWDALTHRNSAVVNHFELLRTLIYSTDGYKLYVYKLLQHLSTAFGLLVLAWWIKAWLNTTSAQSEGCGSEDAGDVELAPKVKLSIAGGIIAVSAFCGAAAGFMQFGVSLERWLFHVVVAGLSGFVLASLLYCLAWWALAGRRQRNA
ncbi:DUF4184 family protein [Undibacterium sp.]|uniref:DUF4184 family protein n=1 Tax=Undibacterium sp. TaxID=1914977 RepID=UPI002C67EF04|nr:DUF4184 family protein [Undibacterium sp.]HTD04243.1 DUF4184 family protein [Undibacterium sp.]